jgi:phage replication-related protein YjqB (UPF0714/DUF867 family)
VFDELLAHPGVEEVSELGSTFGFMAYHGGSLEEVTDVIAREAAARSGASLYAVVQPPDFRWHIPSTAVRPEHSTALTAFLDHVDVVVTVHGYGRQDFWTTLLLGGRNRALAEHLAGHLRMTLPDYTVVTDLEEIPQALRGLHAENPVNLPRGGGVQLELPPRVRGRSPIWADWEGPGLVPHTEALIDGLASAARSWPVTATDAR